MRFWDSSAIVPLLIAERHTRAAQAVLVQDTVMMVWWATPIECVSALALLEREDLPARQAFALAFERLKQFAASWQEIDPSDQVREAAIRFLRVHSLRAADAMQLAAAFVAADRQPSSLELVTLDERLAAAAQREGFAMVDVLPAD